MALCLKRGFFVSEQVTEDPPTYVNAKQYRRIIKRREARAKLEARRKVPQQRKVGHVCSETCAPKHYY